MLPFLVLLSVLGVDGIRRALAARIGMRCAVTGVLAAGLVAQGASVMVDLYTAYPALAAPAFDTGEIAAITIAHNDANGHHVYLSSTMDALHVAAALLPPPPSHGDADDATPGLASLGMQVVAPGVAERDVSRRHAACSRKPTCRRRGWTLVAVDAPANPLDAATPTPVLESVYRLG